MTPNTLTDTNIAINKHFFNYLLYQAGLSVGKSQ